MLNWIYFIFLGTLGWGMSLYLIKILLISLTPVEIVFYRMMIGSLFLCVLIYLLRLRIAHLKYLLVDGVMFGIFNTAIPFYLITWAEKNVSSSLAAVINGLTPIFTFLIGITIFSRGQKFNPFVILSILVGFVGIVIVNIDFNFGQGRFIDLAALVASTVSYGIAANYIRYQAKTKEPILTAAIAALVSAGIMFAYHMIQNGYGNWHVPQNLSQLLALLWLGVISSGVSLYLYCLLIRRASAVMASMIAYLMTITGVTLGIVVLHEHISLLTLVGCMCIILSLILINHAHQLATFIQARVSLRT